MEYSVILWLYVFCVMGMVDKCLIWIWMLEIFQFFMYEFGERYVNYSVKYDFIDVRFNIY